MLLDASLAIRMLSAALERTLGWDREQVEGRSWPDVVTPTDVAEVTRLRLERALAGAVRTIEMEAMANAGQRLQLIFDAALVGRGPDQGLLLTLSSARPAADRPPERRRGAWTGPWTARDPHRLL